MTKAIPAHPFSQGEAAAIAANAGLSGPTFWTPTCGYSVVQGLLFDHIRNKFWIPPDDSLGVNHWTDYSPLLRSIRKACRALSRELREAISPRRKRAIRRQLEDLAAARMFIETAMSLYSDLDNAGALQ